MSQVGNVATTEEQDIKHQYLTSPILYLKNLPSSVSDEEVMRVAIECLRARPRIDRSTTDQYGFLSGSIEFEKLHNAEKAYATLQDVFLPAHNYTFSLSLTPHQNYLEDPKPQSKPRLVKQLPLRITPGAIFDKFRVFGPIYRIALQQDLGFSNTIAIIDFYEEQHAINAQTSMHCSDIDGHTIAVQIYEAAKGPIRGLPQRNSWAEAPSFTPRQFSAALPSNSAASMWATPPPRRTASAQHFGLPPPELAQQPGMLPYGLPMVPAPMTASPPAAPFIDPTNLFVKGLDPLITSQDLFAAFKPFGRIVSARVMRDEHTGLSKEFGFVSFTRAEDAAMAQQGMHGQPMQGTNSISQAITVRFHEPKKQRVSSYGGKRPYGMPREREGSFDSVAQMTEDIARRVSGMSPTSSPPLSPAPTLHSTIMRQASTSSSGSSTPATGDTERDRFLTAIRPHSNSLREAEQLADLLLSLNKKDRALCLFNQDYLLSKMDDARTVLAAVESPLQNSYPTPRPTPESRSSAKFSSEAPAWTLTSLAALPAGKIIDLVHSDSPPPFLANPDPNVEAETDQFIDSLQGKPEHELKQKLGEKLFKVVKGFGFKNSPKITIYLLDHEELRPLAHLMNEQSEVLKEKIAQIQNRL